MTVLRVGHSPDADDAFMFYPFAAEKVAVEGFQVEQVLEDIESLNRKALRGELEVTAISAGIYPRVADKYRIMACGASVGRGYGPIIVTRAGPMAGGLDGARIAVPGEHTTAYLLLRIYVTGSFVPEFVPFDQVVEAVSTGTVDAGVVIHEGQITLEAQGYTKALDLGKEWAEDTGLPIPLGLDVVHRRLGEEGGRRVTEALESSIRYAIAHEDEAMDYALPFGRGIDKDTCRRFVRMYVNQDTVNMGDEGRKALEVLYRRAYDRGLIPAVPPLDIIGLA